MTKITKGCGTKFSIPKERQNVSLYIPRIIASYKIWVNGVFILETGRVGKSRSETLQRRFIRIIPLDAHDTDFEVVIQVANFYNKKAGITWGSHDHSGTPIPVRVIGKGQEEFTEYLDNTDLPKIIENVMGM